MTGANRLFVLVDSGGPASDDLEDIKRDLEALRLRINEITTLVDEADARYNQIDLIGLDERVDSVKGELSSLTHFSYGLLAFHVKYF